MAKSKKSKYNSFLNARLTSTISISLVLFILGIIALLGILTTQLSAYVKENIGFSIVLDETAQESHIKQIQQVVDKAPYVRAVQYISKEDALKELEVELGENPKDFLGFNPLQASVEVKLKADYANNDSISIIEKKLRKLAHVQEIVYQKDLVHSVNENMKRITMILLLLAAVLMLISFTLISNTIRLSAYSKRFTIYTMKLVGASPGFIRRPFIVNNIVNGVIAGFIAIALLTGCIFYTTSQIDNFQNLIDFSALLWLYLVVIALGVIISAVSAFFAVNKYIRMDRDDLYYI